MINLLLCLQVNCRTGSLENKNTPNDHTNNVNCRTGSLETGDNYLPATLNVNCRTGSLEKKEKAFTL
ncbi:conserved hypothetical protein [Desulfamplus magnetovallimortis]|uniref:Uncharacterized protein n=1 Tax=Desulfamplus magnetovallimortis TaxID=1246637 RepID=A0A1W1HHS4_9BACT|nr:conserved hypothetical protein [Desulfamplus magnetovallimortis]